MAKARDCYHQSPRPDRDASKEVGLSGSEGAIMADSRVAVRHGTVRVFASVL